MNRPLSEKIDTFERRKSRIARNASVAFRAERMIARRRMSVVRSQTGLMAFAGLVTGIGLIMLNVAAFFWLASSVGNSAAALIVALVNFVLAVVLAIIAGRMSADAELAPATEVRDMALAEIETELSDTLDEVRDTANELRAMARDPLGSLTPALMGPLISILLKTLKK